MARKPILIDRGKLRAEVRKLGKERVFYMLDDAIELLPVWFRVLSATAEPEEYAKRIIAMLSRHYSYGREKMLAIARRTATTHQRKALAEVEGA
jgi:hypothetical protein